MKKMLLTIFGVGLLVMSMSPTAQAASYLAVTVGGTTISCNNSTPGGVAACLGGGFVTVLGGNTISLGPTVITDAGTTYTISSIDLTGNQPGAPNPIGANSSDVKSYVARTAGAAVLMVDFASSGYFLPAGSPLILSASQSGTGGLFTAGTTEAFTGYGNAANTLAVVGVAAVTPVCTLSGLFTTSCSTNSLPVLFPRAGPFALAGHQDITPSSNGSSASFTATVSAFGPLGVPEPSSLVLLGTGLLVAGWFRRK